MTPDLSPFLFKRSAEGLLRCLLEWLLERAVSGKFSHGIGQMLDAVTNSSVCKTLRDEPSLRLNLWSSL